MVEASETKFNNLTKALDYLVAEAAHTVDARVFNDTSGMFDRDKARSRAYIHLYLEVAHRISTPEEREKLITEGPGDGGLDAYFIDHNAKSIFLIQSKFRTSHTGFEQKSISPSELTKMHLESILTGQTHTEDGEKLNGRVRSFQRKFSDISSIATYKHIIVMLANLSSDTAKLIRIIFNSYEISVYDFDRTYEELLFPFISSESYYDPELSLHISTSDKASAPRLTAQVETRFGPCQLSVFLVPTSEIAKTLNQYKNSILRFNPRSYLEFEQQGTNFKIKETVENDTYGEFALLNNGITMIVDRCSFTDRTGVAGRAGILVENPQIINGGQTAFTLATVWNSTSERERVTLFSGKEVLVRVISLEEVTKEDRPILISDISVATNTQTAVTHADRKANIDLHRQLAVRLFNVTGLLYEYKAGGYSVSKRSNIVDESHVLDRNTFHRLAYMATGEYGKAIRRSLMSRGRSLLNYTPKDTQLARIPRLLSLYRMAADRYTGRTGVTQKDITQECVIAEGVRLAAESLGKEVSQADAVALSRNQWGRFLRHSQQANDERYEALSPDERGALNKRNIKRVERSKWVESAEFKRDLVSFGSHLLTNADNEGRHTENVFAESSKIAGTIS